MPAKKLVKHPLRGPAAPVGNGSRPPIKSRTSRAEAIDRLERLRSVVPVFAQELISARRQAAQLRAENGWLIEQARQMQRERAASNGSAPLPASTNGR